MELADADYFDWDELERIYREAQSDDLETLRAAARRLFPERAPALLKGLYVREGGGRAFRQPDGSYEMPLWTFGGSMVREIGIMADGSVRRY